MRLTQPMTQQMKTRKQRVHYTPDMQRKIALEYKKARHNNKSAVRSKYNIAQTTACRWVNQLNAAENGPLVATVAVTVGIQNPLVEVLRLVATGKLTPEDAEPTVRALV